MSSESLGGTSTPPALSSPTVDRTTARYLFAISVLAAEGGERITTGELQESLDVTPASVTEMAAKLEERGLVDYEKYRGVTLTADGEMVATRVARRFCIVTRFFESVLDTELDSQTAFAIGFLLPEEAISRLREFDTHVCLDLCPESQGETDCCPA